LRLREWLLQSYCERDGTHCERDGTQRSQNPYVRPTSRAGRHSGPHMPTGSIALWSTIMLVAYLILPYL
jgi:hypothetical protein